MSSHRDPNHTTTTERCLLQYADLEKAWDNGEIAIQTWTLPSGNVPFLTLTPASVFIEKLTNYRLPCLVVDKLTAGVRESVATEGDRVHDDLACAMAYALVNHPEKAMDWWLSVGIVRQFLLSPPGSKPGLALRALVHPSWSSQFGKWFDPSSRTVEQAEDAECG